MGLGALAQGQLDVRHELAATCLVGRHHGEVVGGPGLQAIQGDVQVTRLGVHVLVLLLAVLLQPQPEVGLHAAIEAGSPIELHSRVTHIAHSQLEGSVRSRGLAKLQRGAGLSQSIANYALVLPVVIRRGVLDQQGGLVV